jgi:putative ABC transport system permease protein
MIADLRFALRQLQLNPGFAAITVLTLALGIAGNIVIFTIFNSFYLRPFPFAEPERLVDLDETAPRWNLEYTGVAYPDFAGWREHNRSFEGMAVWCFDSYNLSFQGNADQVRAARVTHDLPAVLRIAPSLGRFFTAEEDRPGGGKVAVLGHGFWKRQFGADEAVLGQNLRLNHEPFTIVGILPPDEGLLVEADLWLPLALDPTMRQGWFLRGVGRLRPNVSMAAARDDLNRIHRGLVDSQAADANTSPRLTRLSDRFFGAQRLMIQILLGAVGVVLLIACGNVSALMLARGLGRSRELGLRLSLGATPARLARLIGVETFTLAILGGVAGMVLGRWGLNALLNAVAQKPPVWVSFDLDWRVVLFAGFMVIVSATLGALPVIRAALKVDLRGALQSSALQSTTLGSGRRSLHILVVSEVALTLVLMIQAGLMVQAFHSLQRVDPGYRPDHVLLYSMSLPAIKYGSRESQSTFFEEHLERLRSLPGVTSASAVSAPPLGGHWGNFFTAESAPAAGPDQKDPVVLQRIAFPGYFEAMGIPIISGRPFTNQDGDQDGARAVIVNETFAKRFWQNNNALGQRIRHRHQDALWMTVVGVAKDVKHYGLDQPMIPGVYIPYNQDPQRGMTIVVRASVEPSSLVPSVRALVRQTDTDLAVSDVATMEEQLAQSNWVRRLSASLFAVFSGVALLMAVGGIYGAFSYVVTRRTQEIGVRLALGAQRREVLWLVARQGLAMSGLGAGIGLVVAVMLTPVTGHLLLGVSPVDPLTFTGVALLLTTVAMIACWLPARRAARVDPIVALRCE